MYYNLRVFDNYKCIKALNVDQRARNIQCFFLFQYLIMLYFPVIIYADTSNSSVLNSHGEKYTIDDTLKSAWDAYFHANGAKAIKLFDQALSFPDRSDDKEVQALFGLGTVYAYAAGLTNIPKARNYFLHIIDNHPNSPCVPFAFLKLGLLEGRITPAERERARDYLLSAMQRDPNSLAAHEAVLRLSNLYFYEVDPALAIKGVEILENHLKQYPTNLLAYLMHFRLSYWYQDVYRDYELGLNHSLHAAKFGMSDPQRQCMVYWNIAQIYRLRMNKPEQACIWYKKIIIEYPRDYFVFPAKIQLSNLTNQAE